ncbi:MAG TPA: DUF6186 family protein [Actinophytocola sp.]|uniref:DUF6186 family protein n=1 Tax=Actinophytocola sp. TaxID=1872138 RepID=UPI002DBACE6F|nr:DUF6186 family protein [Actinophytocola sp.]HEU5472792.1 DUF6186 family protein [Actinophytocola sp.]
MTDRTVIIIGFVVVLTATVAAVLLSHLRRDRVATLAETVAQLTRTRAAKIVAVLVWAWLGWHFLAR